MKNKKIIKLSAKYEVKPKQIRDALVITGREYLKIKEYQEEVEKKFRKIFQPHFEIFEKMAKQINEYVTSSGILEVMEKTEEAYSRLLKSYQPEIRDVFISPRNYSRAIFTDEDIEMISEKAAEKIFEKINEKKIVGKSTMKKIIPLNIPTNTKWENITVKIFNENNVTIFVGSNKYETDYKKMGFKDSRTGHPNKQWMFLWLLAVNNGSLSWEDYRTNNQLGNLSLKDINKFKKAKQLLAETLKNYFEIEGDPFYSYKKEEAYRIRINLTGQLPR